MIVLERKEQIIRPLLRVLAITIALAAPAHAQEISAPEAGDPGARRKMLNEEQAARARGDMEIYLERRGKREAAIATAQARKARDDAAYAEALRQQQDAVAAYEAARTHWERANPACRRNDPVGCPR